MGGRGNSYNKMGLSNSEGRPKRDEGYELLLKGTGSNHRGKFGIWQTDQTGLLNKY